jgi:hypothetical protein
MVRHCSALFVALLVLVCDARAETDPNASRSEPGAAQAAPKLPDDFKLNMMIRSTVIAVNQANKTNNYTVLRDLGSPRFKEANSDKKLAQVFASLRNAKFDLSPVLFFTPKMLSPPALTENGVLRLTGFFDTVPQRVSFDMLFEHVKGDWLIYGINIATERSPATQSQGAAPALNATSSKKKEK